MNSGRMNFLFDLLRSSCAGKGVEWEHARLLHHVQEVLDTGRYWRKPGIPIFERTTIKNYHAVKLTDPSDSQSAFATALDRLGRVDMVVSNVGDSGHKWKSISSARSMLRGRLGRP